MKKSVWKIAPYECFEVNAIEGWLDEMSQNGLQFCDKWGPFCRFERRISPARYRLDPGRIQLDPTEEERMATYRKFGWEFCSPYTRFVDVYRAEDPHTVELHTDSGLLNSLVKRTIRDQLWLCLFFGVIEWNLYHLSDVFVLLGQSYDPAYLPLALFTIFYSLTIIVSILLILTAWQRLKKHPETDIHTRQHLRRGTFWHSVRALLLFSCAAGFLAMLIQLIWFL